MRSNQHQVAAGRVGYGQGVQPGAGHPQGDRFSSISQTLDSLEARLSSMNAPQQQPLQTAERGSSSDLDRTLERLSAQIDRSRPQQPAPPIPSRAYAPQSVQPEPQSGHPFSNAAAEISRRKQALSSGTALPAWEQTAVPMARTVHAPPPGHVMPAPPPTPAISAQQSAIAEQKLMSQFAQLTSKIDVLKSEMSDLRNVVSQPAEPTPSEDLERIAAGIRSLQEAPRFDASAFDALHSELDDVRGRLGTPAQQDSWEGGYSDLAHRIDYLSQTNRAEQIDEIGQKLDDVRSTINTLPQSLESLAGLADGSDREVLEQLAQRLEGLQSTIDALPQSITSQYPEPAEFPIEELGARLEALQSTIETLPDTITARVPSAPEVPVDEFAQRLEALHASIEQLPTHLAAQTPQAEASEVDQRFEALHAAIAELGQKLAQPQVEAAQPDYNVDEQFSALQRSIEHLSQQIGQSEPATAVAEGADYTNHFSSIQSSIEQLPGAQAIERLENRLLGLAEVVEMLAQSTQQAAQPSSNAEPVVSPVDLSAVEARLDEITRAIVAISGPVEPADVDLSGLERLEGRMTELAQMVELLAERQVSAQASPEIDDLARRMEGLSHQLVEVERLASVPAPAPEVVVPAPDFTVIEQHLHALSNRIDEAASNDSTQHQINNLEQQLLHISGQLGNAQPASVDFAPVEARLGQIEQQLASDQGSTQQAIEQAVQATIELVNKQPQNDPQVSALSGDLQKLQQVVSESEYRTTETFGAVSETLEKIVSRLSGIESNLVNAQQNPAMAAPVAQPVDMAAAMATPVPADPMGDTTPAMQTAQFADLVSMPEPAPVDPVTADEAQVTEPHHPQPVLVDDVPPLDLADHLEQEAVLEAAPVDEPIVDEDTRPLEPGTNAPDIAELVKKATQRLDNAGAPTPSIDGGKTDYVAAARRAAQAAAAGVQNIEMEKPEDGEADEVAEGKAASSSKFSLAKKPVIVAAAAVLMAVLALTGSRMFLGGSNPQVAVSPVKTIERVDNGGAVAPSGQVQPLMAEKTTVRNVDPAASQPQGNLASTAPAGSQPTANVSGFDGNSKPADSDKFIAATPPASGDGSANPAPSAPTAANPKPAATEAPKLAGGVGPQALQLAAAKGNATAQFEIGLRYTEARGAARNMKKAANWYQKSAANGFAPAQYRLGSLYEKGVGVQRDIAKASMWYTKAAEQGNARAMHNLAVISAMGANGKTDMATATRWFHSAANLGVKDSQFNLGILYGQGMGLPQNLTNSYKWFALAAKTGDSDAAKKRDEVANIMEPAELEKARALVTSWKPAEINNAANRVVVPEEWRAKSATRSATATTSERAMVQKAQALLNKQGFNVGSPDGVAGPKTRRAILEFQKKSGLPETGTVDQNLLKALQAQNI
ncbi:MAG: peptidoglycan-binding protein [Pseudomonadota bacterium]